MGLAAGCSPGPRSAPDYESFCGENISGTVVLVIYYKLEKDGVVPILGLIFHTFTFDYLYIVSWSYCPFAY